MSYGEQVEVLLATYNGERFLHDQIDSILKQSYAPLRIRARDDGSRDATAAILDEYAGRFPERFEVMATAAPTGNAKWNFIQLLAASNAPYVALADQDDVWLPEKIELEMKAMHALEQKHGADLPLLVFCDLQVVDEALETRHPSFWKHQSIDPRQIDRFPRLVAQNVVTGCTALLNRPLAKLALSMPPESFMHDWWIALLASGFGAAAFVREPQVLYRQHGGNVVGAIEHARNRRIPRWRYHEKRRERWEMIERQAEALLRLHGTELTVDKRSILEAYVRSETHPNRIVRVATWLRHGYFLSSGLRANLAIAWYLWDMKAAKLADI